MTHHSPLFSLPRYKVVSLIHPILKKLTISASFSFYHNENALFLISNIQISD